MKCSPFEGNQEKGADVRQQQLKLAAIPNATSGRIHATVMPGGNTVQVYVLWENEAIRSGS
jgi:hypothetical protein